LSAIFLEQLFGDQAKAHFEGGRAVAILPLGSTEYHGPGGPYGTDTYVAAAVAQRVSAETGALVLPALGYGHSPDHRDYAGTLHLRRDTLTAILIDILESLRRHGASGLLLLVGHWGNYDVAMKVRQISIESGSRTRVEVVRVFDDLELDLAELDEVFGGKDWRGHGGAGEVSVALYAEQKLRAPSREHLARAMPAPESRDYGAIGWQGLPEEASAARGERVVDVMARAVVKYMRDRFGGR
jgi:creatinine amidohydrolase